MITLCCPTRERPERFAEMVASARDTATNHIEIIAVLDVDDPRADDYSGSVCYIKSAPESVHSDLWNQAWRYGTGDTAGLVGDDVVFRTPGWDVAVADSFALWPDRIGMVYTENGTRENRPEHPFVSREWINAAGFFTPPYFRSWFADRWLWEVSAAVGRRHYLKGVVIEHMSPAYGKAPNDPLYERAANQRAEDNPLADYERRLPERLDQIERIRNAMQPGDFVCDTRSFGV